MKRAEQTENKLDKVRYLRRVISVCWIALAACFIIKLFGGNLFEIACANSNFIAICDYANTHLWLNYIMSALYCFISLYFFTLAILQRTKYKKWELVILTITVLGGTSVKVFWNEIAGFVFDVWTVVFMPMLFLGKNYKRYIRILFANGLLMAFQLISIYVRNIHHIILDENAFVGMLFSIDVLIMLVLYFSYSNLLAKENVINKNKEEPSNG